MKRMGHLLLGLLTVGVATYINAAYAEHDSATVSTSESYRAYGLASSVEPIVTRRFTTEPESCCTWVREEPQYCEPAALSNCCLIRHCNRH